MDGLRSSAPVFVGTLLGLFAVYSGMDVGPVAGVLAVIASVGAVFRWSGRAALRTNPVAAVRMWQGAVLVPVALIAATAWGLALCGSAVVRILPLLPSWLVSVPTDAADAKGLLDALNGAIATFVGAMWLDDTTAGKSPLWPPAQLQAAFETAFRPTINDYKSATPPRPGMDHRTLERAVTGDETGWSFADAMARARVVGGFL